MVFVIMETCSDSLISHTISYISLHVTLSNRFAPICHTISYISLHVTLSNMYWSE